MFRQYSLRFKKRIQNVMKRCQNCLYVYDPRQWHNCPECREDTPQWVRSYNRYEYTGVPKLSIWDKFLIRLGWKDPIILEIESPFNGKGFPEVENMTWKYCSANYYVKPCRFMTYITVYYIPPKICQICSLLLKIEKWDEWEIENTKQYMVWSYTCPDGHGHYVEWM